MSKLEIVIGEKHKREAAFSVLTWKCAKLGFTSRISTKTKKVPFAPQAHKQEHCSVIDCCIFILTWTSTAGPVRVKKKNIADPGMWDRITFPIIMPFEPEQ